MRLMDIVILSMTEEYQEQVRRYVFYARLLPNDVDSDDDTRDLVYDDATCRMVYKTM
jgi:hypothetical protein